MAKSYFITLFPPQPLFCSIKKKLKLLKKVFLYFVQSEIIKFVTPRSPCRDFLDRLVVSHLLLLAVNSKRESKFEYILSNFGSFIYFQTFLSLGVKQGLQKLPKFDINDLRLLFHCYILIPRKCPHKTPFKTQCPPSPSYDSHA